MVVLKCTIFGVKKIHVGFLAVHSTQMNVKLSTNTFPTLLKPDTEAEEGKLILFCKNVRVCNVTVLKITFHLL